MKHILLSILILSFIFQAKAQKIDFIDSTNIWYYVSSYKKTKPQTGYQVNYYYYNYKGDTVINNKSYRKLFAGETYLRGLVRFDSSDNKVYVIIDSNIERTLYDYNLKLGDTVSSITEINCPVNNTRQYIKHYVSKIDSVLLNNIYHKRRTFSIVDYNQYSFCFAKEYDVIEGVGCTYDLFFPLSGAVMPTVAYISTLKKSLICLKNNGNVPTATGITFICNDTTLTVSELQNAKTTKLYPQPVHSYFTLELPTKINNGNLYLHNCTGQRVFQRSLINQNKVRVNNISLPSGMYYYNVQDNKQVLYRGKLLVE
ncbi:MAG: T9SS type A sorting domain-containing protein [Flavipsychrobacter sp.]